MYTCVRLWVCTCGDVGAGCVGGGCVGGGWDVYMCEFVVVWVVVGMYTYVSLWWCGWWLGCIHM